ncbi:MAG: serine/threonine-protein kinase [Planctomycetota bacterium]|nr:serine/threonine-protein kinase [Planctomycetota bacterium]
MTRKPDPTHEVCYSREVLADFVLGKLPPQDLERIAAQVENCPTCNAVLQTLDGLEDSVVNDLKKELSSFSGQPSPELERRLRRAETLGHELQRTQPVAAGVAAQPPMHDDNLPKTFGQYQLLERIGQGGMGTVYKAHHTRLKRPVAIKLLPTGRTRDPQAVARFQGEMEAVGRLDHPNLVRAHDAGEAEGQHFLAMEYLDGIDLARLVRSSGPLPITDACEAIRQAAIGLQYAHHHGLVHRDVKPSNLMRTAGGVIKVLDLGLARLSSDQPGADQMTETGQVLGTGDYISPEQGQDARHADARSDIYSLGCTLHFLLAGRAPFASPEHSTFAKKVVAHTEQPIPPIMAIRGDVPDALVMILGRMTAKLPAERFQTAAEVAAALETCVTDSDPKGVAPEQTTGPTRFPDGSVRPLPRFARRGLLLVGFLVLVAVLTILAHRYGGRVAYAVRNLPDPTENERASEEVNADLGQLVQEVQHDLAAMQRERESESNPTPPTQPPQQNVPVVTAGVRQSDRFDIWLVIGPFLYDSRDEAYDAEHAIEKEPFDANRRFDTTEGQVGWRRFEAAPEVDGKVVLVEAAGRAPPAGRVGVYYAVCWAKFAGSHRAVDLRFRSSCPYKLWVNRTSANGSPGESGNFGGGVLSHGGTGGWNELFFKFVVFVDRKPPADFRLRFRHPEDTFGRLINQPLPSITIESPQDGRRSAK